jgi:hypothetical protein
MFFPFFKWISQPFPLRFRAKPGAKYTYRYSTDLWEPEWGIVPTQKGRLIRQILILKILAGIVGFVTMNVQGNIRHMNPGEGQRERQRQRERERARERERESRGRVGEHPRVPSGFWIFQTSWWFRVPASQGRHPRKSHP